MFGIGISDFESEFLICKVWNQNFWFSKCGIGISDFESIASDMEARCLILSFAITNLWFEIIISMLARYSNLKSQISDFETTFLVWNHNFFFGTKCFWCWTLGVRVSDGQIPIKGSETEVAEGRNIHNYCIFFCASRDEHAIMLCYFIQSLSTHNETFMVLDWTSWTQSFWFQIPKQKFWNKSGIRAKTKLHYFFFLRLRRGEMKHDIMFMSVLCLVYSIAVNMS